MWGVDGASAGTGNNSTEGRIRSLCQKLRVEGGLWVGHGRAGDGLMSAFPASCFTQGTSRRMCATVGVGGGALVQPPQPLRAEQHPFCHCRAEACHEYSSTTDIESGRVVES